MKYYESCCVNCGLPCTYESCKYYKVLYFKCDCCGEENVKLYNYDDDEICEDCLLKKFEVVEGSDW